MNEKSSFTLVIPCYNEEEVIESFLVELNEFINQFNRLFVGSILKVKIIDNNSTDRSLELLSSTKLNTHIEVLNCKIQGYGASLKAGFSSEHSDYYAFADLDNTYPLVEFIDMFQLILKNKVDLVYGVRIHAKSKIDFIRKFGNRFYIWMLQLFYAQDVTDACTGMRIFSSRVKSEIINLKEKDLSFSIELTVNALLKKWSFLEHPILYRERIGESKLSVFFDGFKFLFVVLKLRVFGG